MLTFVKVKKKLHQIFITLYDTLQFDVTIFSEYYISRTTHISLFVKYLIKITSNIPPNQQQIHAIPSNIRFQIYMFDARRRLRFFFSSPQLLFRCKWIVVAAHGELMVNLDRNSGSVVEFRGYARRICILHLYDRSRGNSAPLQTVRTSDKDKVSLGTRRPRVNQRCSLPRPLFSSLHSI